jgi:hypothetical protein
VCLLQIFEAGEGFVEILRQVEDLLRHFNDLFFFRAGDLNQLLNDHVSNQGVSLELLANLESDVK